MNVIVILLDTTVVENAVTLATFLKIVRLCGHNS